MPRPDGPVVSPRVFGVSGAARTPHPDEEDHRGQQCQGVLCQGGPHRLGLARHQSDTGDHHGHDADAHPLQPHCPAKELAFVGGEVFVRGAHGCSPSSTRKRSRLTSSAFSPSRVARTSFRCLPSGPMTSP